MVWLGAQNSGPHKGLQLSALHIGAGATSAPRGLIGPFLSCCPYLAHLLRLLSLLPALLFCLAAASSFSSLPYILLSHFRIKGMTLPSISGVDPDPTTQIPWPGARKRSDRELDHDAPGTTTPPVNSNHASRRGSTVSRVEMNGQRRRLSTLDLFNLSISMAGAQIAWTVELG